MRSPEPTFGIGEVSDRTGLGQSTLRMWETRHDFPQPRRLSSGRRAYSRSDIEQINAVLRSRNEGLSLPAAIERARRIGEKPQLSVFRALREKFTHLHPRAMNKQALLWITRAVEEECAVRAVNPLLIGGFQEECFFRLSEHRWRLLARNARRTIALAGFSRLRTEPGAPAEVPLGPTDALLQEWIVICLDENLLVCLAGRERPETGTSRGFEALWSVEPAVVLEAARVCLKLIARTAPSLADDLLSLASGPARPVEPADLRIAIDLATRVTAHATKNSSG